MSKLIRVNDDVWEKLNSKALEHNLSIGRMVESLVNGGVNPAQSTVDLVDKLDYEAEHPESSLSDEDRAILENLAPGELPECCQEIFDDPEHPVPTCKHWRKAHENFYGQRMWGYVNDLVGGGYRTWFSKYVK